MANTLIQESQNHSVQADHEGAILRSLFMHAKRAPMDTAFRDLGNGETEIAKVTFAELAARAEQFGEHLQSIAKPLSGDTTPSAVLQFSPGLDYIAAIFACWWAGVTPVPAYLPRSSRHSERLAAILRDCNASFVLTTPNHVDRVSKISRSAAPNAQLIELSITCFDPPSCKAPKVPEFDSPMGPALIQYTSGSTGSPKGVIVTHANLLHNVESILAGLPSPPKVSVSWLPPYHDMGLISKILLPVHAGIEAVQLSPFGFMQRPFRWLKAISDYRGSFSGAPDSAYDLCCRRITDAEKKQLDLSSWEVAFNGSEPVRHNTLLKFSETFQSCGFNPQSSWPVYGLAEATLCVTQPSTPRLPRSLKRKEDGRTFVSCGVPLKGMDVKIVSRSDNSGDDARIFAGDQEEGEIAISGPSVASGYFGRREATDEIFKVRIDSDSEETYLRSGDLGFLSNGELFVTGRVKNILIFNGQNFHPEDLERAAEQCHPSLHVGGIAAFACEDASGREQLALALEVAHRETQNYEAIVKAVRETIGSQFDLRPAAMVCVKDWRLPRTTSGKIQRNACATQLKEGWKGALYVDDQRRFRATCTPDLTAPPEILKTVCATMEEVFGISTIEPNTDFFELGGHSLTATRVASRLSASLNRSIPIRMVFEAPTPNELATAIAQECETEEAATNLAPPHNISVLTPSQRRMWFLHITDPTSSAYNVGGALGVEGEFDATTALRAFRMCLEAHPVLRATYGTRNGLPFQRISPTEDIDLRGVIRDYSGFPNAVAQVKEDVALLTKGSFDLEHGPLYRFRIFKLADDSHVLAVGFHHIVVDGWAVGILVRDLFKYYTLLREGRDSELAMPQSDALFPMGSSVKIQKQLGYWKTMLKGAQDLLDLPVDHSPPRPNAADGSLHKIPLPADLLVEMRDAARRLQSSTFMVMLAGFQILLARYARQQDFLIGIPVANRNHQESENVIASMVNTLPYRANMGDNPPLSELLVRVRSAVLDMQDNQDAPLEDILDSMDRTGATGSSPFRVMFDYQEVPLPENGSLKFNTNDWETHRGAAQFDLSLFVSDINGDYLTAIEYKPALFDAATIQQMGDHFVNILWRLVQTENGSRNDTVLSTPLLSRHERQEVIRSHNYTALKLNENETLLHDFARSAAENPTATAISCGDTQISYAEADRASNRVARLLQEEGIGSGDSVAVYLERSAEMVVTLLGILKSGACYVPLDPEYPAARIAMILEDARPSGTVTQISLAEKVDCPRTFLIDDPELRSKLDSISDAPVDFEISPDNIAYIIFTSGSTGRPKGVEIPHRGLHNFLHSMAKEPGLEKGDTLLAVTTVSFDISGLEMFLPLICGARAHIARRDEALDGRHLIASIEALDVTHLQATPATWQLLLTCGWKGKQDGRPLKMLCGGEELPKELASQLLQCGGELWNLYGPTETTIWSTVQRITTADSISIGNPIGNTQCYVLDEHFEPVPAGVSGELYIGGHGVAAGYHNRPDLTADRFVPDPFAGNSAAQMYRTGDLARYDSSGELHYLGRLDHQVKIRGHRIELGEIASALDSHSHVRRSVVTAIEIPRLGKSLVAYCEATETDTDTKILLDHIRDLLPAYMVPTAVVIMETLPQTPNGKIDRNQLPLPQAATSSSDFVAPKNELERRMAQIWADLLNVPEVGTTDDFFSLGGHSLLAAQAFVRMKDELGIDLPLNALFDQATVSALAERWEQGRIEQHDLPAGVVKLHGPEPDASPHPTALLWIHPLGGGGGGGLLSYREMARNLPNVHSFGIREAGEKFDTLEEMAQSYASSLDKAVPQGPVALAGFCFGGNLALEVARKMTTMGRVVQDVFLLDARPVSGTKPNWQRILGAASRILTGTADERQRLMGRAKRNLQHRLHAVIVGGESHQYIPDLEEILDLKEYPESYREIARHHWTLLQRHKLTAYSGSAIVLQSTPENSTDDATGGGWRPFVPDVSVEPVSGKHEAFLRSKEMMRRVSEVIGQRLTREKDSA